MSENPDDERPDSSEKIQPDSESYPDNPDQVSEANDSEFDDDIDEDAEEEK